MDKTAKGAKPTPTKRKPAAKTKAAGTAARSKKLGRPTTFTQALADAICSAIVEGKSLRAICEAEAMPDKATVLRWLADESRADFCDQYARAREAQADTLAEQMLQIADDGTNDTQVDDEGNVRIDHDHIARSRLRVDARKWLASKLAPKKYGDKVTTEHTGADGGAIKVASTIRFVMPETRSDDE